MDELKHVAIRKKAMWFWELKSFWMKIRRIKM